MNRVMKMDHCIIMTILTSRHHQGHIYLLVGPTPNTSLCPKFLLYNNNSVILNNIYKISEIINIAVQHIIVLNFMYMDYNYKFDCVGQMPMGHRPMSYLAYCIYVSGLPH